MKRFIRLILLAGVLAGLVAWLKELIAGTDPPAEAGRDRSRGDEFAGDSLVSTGSSESGSSASNGGPTRQELYEEAQRLEIRGRSKMSKQELERAIESARS